MKKLECIFLFLFIFNVGYGQITFCGKKVYPAPVFSQSALAKLQFQLSTAQEIYQKDTTHADAIIWFGRRLAYLGRYDEAIQLFSLGIKKHPSDARMYRHRGHRYLTTRCWDKALDDFIMAAKLIKNKPDQVEPDGMPNDKNIPTSTLQSNIWYHLGLAFYIKQNYQAAVDAFEQCLKVSKNPDMYVATANWYYISLLELDRKKEADALLLTITEDMELIENEGYHQILMLYKNENGPSEKEENLLNNLDNLQNTTLAFGLGNYYRLKGDKEKAMAIFKGVVDGNQWGSFAYMAAESKMIK